MIDAASADDSTLVGWATRHYGEFAVERIQHQQSESLNYVVTVNLYLARHGVEQDYLQKLSN